jgi:fructokinase
VEAGGSKFVCAVGTHPGDMESIEFPTTTPPETVSKAVEFFRSHGKLGALGIGSFGPIDPNPKSATFGYILSTPKLAWRNFDLAGALRDALRVPVAFDTDVNAAALAESRWGAAQGRETFLYLTVGTGIGGGAMVGGRLLHGRQHPEMGHIRVPHDRERDPFPGNCPYHSDCLDLPPDHPVWDLFINYLVLGLSNWICTLSPEIVVLGGGIMQRGELFPPLRLRVSKLLNGYLKPPDLVAPALGARAGVLGAIALAEMTLLPARQTLHV